MSTMRNKRITGMGLVFISMLSAGICVHAEDQVEARTRVFKRMDADRDGSASFDEYSAVRKGDPEAARKSFDSFDKNKDGTLTEQEFVYAGKK